MNSTLTNFAKNSIDAVSRWGQTNEEIAENVSKDHNKVRKELKEVQEKQEKVQKELTEVQKEVTDMRSKITSRACVLL